MSVNAENIVYADYAATTPMLPEVTEAIGQAFASSALNANPNSATHVYGVQSAAAVETAKQRIGSLINADASSLLITSGATESNYLAIRGIALGYQKRGKHVITIASEHKATLNPIQALGKEGFTVDTLSVDAEGQINFQELESHLTDSTTLLALSLVNNETGIMPDIQAISELCHQRNVHLHIDAAQAFGKVPIDVKSLNCASMSISGHKIYGPKGIGALYVRPTPKVRMADIFNGGSQGLRPGTPATPLIIGLGEASRLAASHLEFTRQRLTELRQQVITELEAQIPDIKFLAHSDANRQWPGIVSIKLPNTPAQAVMQWLSDRVAFSAGSACSSGMSSPSHVLKAMGLSNTEASHVIRLSFGQQTTADEVTQIIDWLIDAIQRFQYIPAK